MRRVPRMFALSVLILAGCGSDGGDPSSATGESTTTTVLAVGEVGFDGLAPAAGDDAPDYVAAGAGDIYRVEPAGNADAAPLRGAPGEAFQVVSDVPAGTTVAAQGWEARVDNVRFVLVSLPDASGWLVADDLVLLEAAASQDGCPGGSGALTSPRDATTGEGDFDGDGDIETAAALREDDVWRLWATPTSGGEVSADLGDLVGSSVTRAAVVSSGDTDGDGVTELYVSVTDGSGVSEEIGFVIRDCTWVTVE